MYVMMVVSCNNSDNFPEMSALRFLVENDILTSFSVVCGCYFPPEKKRTWRIDRLHSTVVQLGGLSMRITWEMRVKSCWGEIVVCTGQRMQLINGFGQQEIRSSDLLLYLWLQLGTGGPSAKDTART